MSKISEERKEIVGYGIGIGCVMFIVNMLYLGLQKDSEFLLWMMAKSAYLLIAYVLFGILFFFLYTRKPKKEHWFLKSLTKGVSGLYMIGNIMPMIFVIGLLLADTEGIRILLLLDFLVIVGFQIIDYKTVHKISDELNQRSSRTRCLLEDLDERPKSKEDFCCQIERYCEKNGYTIEFIERSIPAKILMNGTEYTVELEQFYSQFGPIYSMKFIERY